MRLPIIGKTMKGRENMKKKIFAVILAALICMSMSACGKSTPKDNTSSDTASVSSSSSSESSEKIEVDSNLLSVEVTFPASYFENVENFNADTFASENGYEKATQNEDGSVTVTMTKAKHQELLDSTKETIETTFQEIIQSADYPFVSDISHSDNFDTVTIKVDKTGYEQNQLVAAFLPLTVAVQPALYQVLDGKEAHVTVEILDDNSGDTLTSVTYPDDINQ